PVRMIFFPDETVVSICCITSTKAPSRFLPVASRASASAWMLWRPFSKTVLESQFIYRNNQTPSRFSAANRYDFPYPSSFSQDSLAGSSLFSPRSVDGGVSGRLFSGGRRGSGDRAGRAELFAREAVVAGRTPAGGVERVFERDREAEGRRAGIAFGGRGTLSDA